VAERGAVRRNPRPGAAVNLVPVEAGADAGEIDHIAAIKRAERGCIADRRRQFAQQRLGQGAQRST
jgi:hypothetical protein